MIQEFEFVKPEWAHIVLKEEFFQPKISVTAELSATWRPCDAGEERFDHQREEMGVRLQQTFGLDVPAQNMHYTREERSEDIRYANMSEKEYREYFQYRLLSDLEHRPGIAYLHALKVAKERIAQEEFVPTLHLRYLKQFAEMAARHKIKILLINNPESPISLGWYANSVWYKSHIAYLKSLESENLHFVDLHEALRIQDFSDFHHITYPGMIKMNPVYGKEIISFL